MARSASRLVSIGAILGVGLGTALAAGAVAQAAPRLVPDHDVMGTYRIEQPGRAAQTWRVRFQAASRMVRAVSIAGQAEGVTVLLDLASGAANVVVPQMHAVVAVPGLSGLIHKVLDERGTHFTPLGTATVAGERCTRYLVLKRKGDGSACITPGGVVLAATGKDARGSLSVTALQVVNAPQPPGDFTVPQGYSALSLPPQILAQLLGG